MGPDRREEMRLRGTVTPAEGKVARMGLALAVTTEETRKGVAVAVMRGMGMGAVAVVVLLVAGALPMDVLEEATLEASQVARWAG